MWNTTSPPSSKISSTISPAAASTGRRCCRISGRISARAIGDTKDLTITQVIDALDEDLGPHFFPVRRKARIPASARPAASGPPRPEARPVRRLHRLLELSELPLYPAPRRRERRWRQADALTEPKLLGIDEATGLPVTLRKGPYGRYVQLGEPTWRRAGGTGPVEPPPVEAPSADGKPAKKKRKAKAKEKPKDKPKRASLPRGVVARRRGSDPRHRPAVAAPRSRASIRRAAR